MMNPEAQELLNNILKKDQNDLSQDDILFLRARQSYLSKAQLDEYNNVLNPKVKKESKEDTKPSEEPKPVKEDANTKQTN